MGRFRDFLEKKFVSGPTVPLYAYNFVEELNDGTHTLFRLFSSALVGKKVLVISPFSETIEAQRPRRHGFFRGYDYPEFELECYTTPITYSGLPAHMYPDRSWAQTLARMKREIEGKDFDIALISCGSYPMPLGAFIRNWMGKKAIYVGSFLQVFFGVIGRRWHNSYFLPQINIDQFVTPLEASRYLPSGGVEAGEQTEGWGAYF